MLEIRVHSTETEKDAYLEIETRDEEEAINVLQGVGFAQLVRKLLEEG